MLVAIQRRDVAWACACAMLIGATILWWRQSQGWKAQVDERELTMRVTEQSLFESKSEAYRLLGETIQWPTVLEITGQCHDAPCPRNGLLMVYVDEAGCQSCDAEVASLVRDVSAAVGRQSVAIVVAAKEARSALAWARTGELDCPVYLDPAGAFATVNRIRSTPIALLLDDEGRVALAERFVVGRRHFASPFKRASERLLRRYAASGAPGPPVGGD